jgi:FixJ family two-component response regulator
MPSVPVRVYIVDSEPSVCSAYARLMRSAHIEARTFASVEDLIRSDFSNENSCVVADVDFAGKSGLDLPTLLCDSGHHLPVIFVTACDTPETRRRAHRAGAAGYFRKPVDDQALLDAIEWAVGARYI